MMTRVLSSSLRESQVQKTCIVFNDEEKLIRVRQLDKTVLRMSRFERWTFPLKRYKVSTFKSSGLLGDERIRSPDLAFFKT